MVVDPSEPRAASHFPFAGGDLTTPGRQRAATTLPPAHFAALRRIRPRVLPLLYEGLRPASLVLDFPGGSAFQRWAFLEVGRWMFLLPVRQWRLTSLGASFKADPLGRAEPNEERPEPCSSFRRPSDGLDRRS